MNPKDPATELPKDPTTELDSAAMACHAMYEAFQAGGFTKKEALYLIAQTLQTTR